MSKTRPRRTARRSLLFSVLLLLIIAASLESVAFLLGEFGILRSRGSFLLSDPRVSMAQSEIEEYFAARDPILGWPTRDRLRSDRHDSSGARPSPAHPRPGSAKVSLYGNSFTYGSDVNDESAWANVLSKLVGNRVANYAVPGYGPDQAFLRFRENVDDESEVVILGFIGDNIIRIINQDRRLIEDQYGGLKLKPRFVSDGGGQLTVVSIPELTADQARAYLRHPEEYLEHEWFLPGSRDGGVVFEFPFTVSVVRAMTGRRMKNLLLNRPSWFEYFTEAHESRAVPLLVEIVSAFDELAAKRGKFFRFVILPSARHLMYEKNEGASPVRLLKDRLALEGISFLDATDQVLSELAGREICEIFAEQYILTQCGGHYNELGNEIIAETIARDLARLRLGGHDNPAD